MKNLRKLSGVFALATAIAVSPAALAKSEKGNARGKGKAGKQTEARKSADREYTTSRDRRGDSTRERDHAADRLRQMDRNGDGVISRSEWSGDFATFDRFDANGDGYLTADEIRRNRDSFGDRLRQFDRNGDGVISRSEWPGDLAQFDRLDINRDGYITPEELRGRRAGEEWREEGGTRFRGVDRNGDGVISRNEWPGNETSFRNHDRNGDGVISGAETAPAGSRR